MSVTLEATVPAATEALRGPVRVRAGGERPYDVLIGADAAAVLPELVPDTARTVALVHDEALSCQVRSVRAALEATGRRVAVLQIPRGEAAKQIGVLAGVWSRFAAAGITRTDAVVGFGGGATCDLAGFAAATWLRGVALLLVPTTLLAMADAAVGGGTGINVPEGRNLVGACHPPAGVVCDPALLATVGDEGHLGGLAEVLKAGFVADPAVLDLVAADPVRAARAGDPLVTELIERAVRVKADAVAEERAWSLEYGHALGRAIERVERHRARPGHAVAVGMVFAAELARLTGSLDDAAVDRHRGLLRAIGLPTSYPLDAWGALRDALRTGPGDAEPRFVVLDGIGRPAVLDDPSSELLDAAYRRTGS
ncbi:3-dehydroquinate synthase family protein [Streptomyces sp. NPDC006274]|uniref:3-dehydroquinate synthase family protein n=1 Tax=unclassified Streptomyces TaxID=2593676 RepID=UPI0033BAAA53